MSKLSIVIFAALLVSVVCDDKKLKEAKSRCWVSLDFAVDEMGEKYRSIGWHKFGKAVKDEALQIYKNKNKEMSVFTLALFKAKTMEVTEEVETHDGTIIECRVDIARGISKITHQLFEELDELYKRVTRGNKGRV